MSEANDGFVLVKSKKKQNKDKIFKKSYLPDANENFPLDQAEIDELIAKINKLKDQLNSHDQELYSSKMLFHLGNILNNFYSDYSVKSKNKIVILCYGLGSFDDSVTSRFQFALFLIIIDYFKEKIGTEIEIKEIYDPLFNSKDKFVLEKILDYKYSNSNTKCIRKVETNSENLTFVFMPHCPKALYNNFLFSNWTSTRLKSVLIMGNSFRSIQSLNNDEHFAKNYCFLNESLKFLKEQKMESKCDMTNAFYDLSFIMFEPSETVKLAINFYDENFDLTSLLEPVYDLNEEVI
ncbi:SRR1 isoform X1 [Brachionus plicatilis]|uniref:SRR1 isoform X1 n=1 Tax=Brachionus plicatilis TaxID=10195 RepID=A0A3M7PJJ7_BRAPC|nr:SRR1 isoform X1 [Brachionus plicatilis]